MGDLDLVGEKDHQRGHVAGDHRHATGVDREHHQRGETQGLAQLHLQAQHQSDRDQGSGNVVGDGGEHEAEQTGQQQQLALGDAPRQHAVDDVLDQAFLVQIGNEGHGGQQKQPQAGNIGDVVA